MKIDAIVLQWIYSTLSDEYLLRVLEPESTALEAWNRVKDIFHNNKGPRCAALQARFVNLRLTASSSLETYCQTLRDLAAQLDDVGSPVNEQTLVLQLVRGLPREYDTIGSIINRELPSWNEACEMLRGDQERQAARDDNANPSEALAAINPTPSQNRRDNQNRRDGPNRYGQQPGRRGPRRDGPGNTQQTHSGSVPPNPTPQRSGPGNSSRGQNSRNQQHHSWAPQPYPMQLPY
ncbi:hypothetical protein Hdeb2414_s0086g00784961 [Helianthus debilis subsp. tardiflorus]